MKTIKTIVMTLAVLTALCSTARDRLYIENFDITQGQTLALPIALANDTAYSALQTDLYLPAGLEVVMDDDEYVVDLTSRKDPSHMVSTSLLANGAIRIYVASQSLKVFAGNSGAVMTVTVKATAPVSHATVALRGSKAVEPDGIKHTLDDCEALANAGAQTVTGDVTDDGRVDIADVNAVINIMLGKAPSVPAADINGNGTVDIADVNAAINIMLGKYHIL